MSGGQGGGGRIAPPFIPKRASAPHPGTEGADGTQGYEEEEDLVVLDGAQEAGQSDKEEEDAHSRDSAHHLETGDQAQPLAPGRHGDHQQAHHLREERERERDKANRGHLGISNRNGSRALANVRRRGRDAPMWRCARLG